MTQVMNPSEVASAAQIGKVCDLLTVGLRKANIQKDPLQQVIEKDEMLVYRLVEIVQQHVLAQSSLIVRHVKVDRSKTVQQVLLDAGRRQTIEPEALDGVPMGEGEEVEVVFFRPNSEEYTMPWYGFGDISDDDLDKAYKKRDLEPDFAALCKVNLQDDAFADLIANGIHWKGSDGKWCTARFRHGTDGQCLDIRRRKDPKDVWQECHSWWFAGVRKTAK